MHSGTLCHLKSAKCILNKNGQSKNTSGHCNRTTLYADFKFWQCFRCDSPQKKHKHEQECVLRNAHCDHWLHYGTHWVHYVRFKIFYFILEQLYKMANPPCTVQCKGKGLISTLGASRASGAVLRKSTHNIHPVKPQMHHFSSQYTDFIYVCTHLS